MPRQCLAVRDASLDDLPDLIAMWDELRELRGRAERSVPVSSERAVRERLDVVAQDPGARALVATVDDEVAGMVLLVSGPTNPLFEQRAVHAHYLHVREGFRRRGVGRALLSAAVAFADETGAEQVVTSVLPTLRDTQRFYARLGFGPVAVQRAAPVSVLRRRLAGVSGVGVAEHLVARRRSLSRLKAALPRSLD